MNRYLLSQVQRDDFNAEPTKRPRPSLPSDEIGAGCVYKGRTYSLGEDFHDGCDQFCSCDPGSGAVFCHEIKCPSSFGLDVINPFCLEWDHHEDFSPSPPMCCPPVPTCKSDGRCEYPGEKFNNFDNIPVRLSGCEKRCYCENGEVLCQVQKSIITKMWFSRIYTTYVQLYIFCTQDACYPLSPHPPSYLSCSAKTAVKAPQEDRPCCLQWACECKKMLLLVFFPVWDGEPKISSRISKL